MKFASLKAIGMSLSIASLCVLPCRAAAVQSVSLKWISSSTPDVTRYTVHYGLVSGNYTEQVLAGTSTGTVIPNLVEGLTYYFVVTGSAPAGVESEPSNEAVYSVPGIAPPGKPSIYNECTTGESILTWSASPSPEVAAYYVYYGTEGGPATELIARIAASDALEFVLPDWMLDMPYYFVVTASTAAGDEIAATGTASITPTVAPAPVLSLQQLPAAGLAGVFSITAAGAVPAFWALQASSDMQSWGTLATGSDPDVDVTVVVSPKRSLFFRLGNSYEDDVQLLVQTPPGAFPKSFCVSTGDRALDNWTIEASENLQAWNPLASGTGTTVNMAVVAADAPPLYFRLTSQ